MENLFVMKDKGIMFYQREEMATAARAFFRILGMKEDKGGRKMKLGEGMTRQHKYGRLSFIMQKRKELPFRCRVLEIVYARSILLCKS